jgi:anti-anti-sigma factor
LHIVREIATDVTIDSSPNGTRVQFQLPAPPPAPPLPEPILPAPHTPVVPSVPAELHIHPESDGGRRLELRGELDLAAATTLRDTLLKALTSPGSASLDLRQVNYLSSAGIGLLIEAAQHAADHGIPVVVQLAPHSLAARILVLTSLDTIVPLRTVP